MLASSRARSRENSGVCFLKTAPRAAAVTATAADLPAAIREAYRLVEGVQFEKAYCRRDIGQKALAAMEG